MVTIRELSAQIKSIFKQNNIENFIIESRCLLEYSLNLSHNQLIVNADTTIPDNVVQTVLKLADKRIGGYPLQYILGQREFFGLTFYVGEGVLIPRQDTEKLVECVLNSACLYPSPRIIDLCSGSGCIAISLKSNISDADVTAVEISENALKYLYKNDALNHTNIKICEGSVIDNVFCNKFAKYDIIVSNPPYLTLEDMNNLQKEVGYEPELSLFGGNDGLLFYSSITSLWRHHLSDNGMIFYEIGIGQETDVANILSSNGFTDIKFYTDLNSIVRVVSGVYKHTTLNYDNHQFTQLV